MIIEEGHYIVERTSFGNWHLHAVVRVSDKRVTVHRYGTREGYVRREDVVFSGPHDSAKRLLDQLTSSRAQMYQDQNAAAARCVKRDDDFIANAKS